MERGRDAGNQYCFATYIVTGEENRDAEKKERAIAIIRVLLKNSEASTSFQDAFVSRRRAGDGEVAVTQSDGGRSKAFIL